MFNIFQEEETKDLFEVLRAAAIQAEKKQLLNTVKETNYYKAIKLSTENDYLRGCDETDEKTKTLILEKNLLEKSYKVREVEKQIAQQQAGIQHCSSGVDSFILTRKLNLPELIFKQDFKSDFNKRTRFFERDHEQRW